MKNQSQGSVFKPRRRTASERAVAEVAIWMRFEDRPEALIDDSSTVQTRTTNKSLVALVQLEPHRLDHDVCLYETLAAQHHARFAEAVCNADD